MDSTHRNNEILRDVRDAKDMINNENSSTTRSYDCGFCKRGFTNAQALGGHMNIHRKDKAKAKKLSESSAAHKACEYFAPISSEQAQYYAFLRASKSYQMVASSAKPNYPQAIIPQLVPIQEFLTPYEDLMGSNLNLRIGLPIMEESRGEIKMEDHGERNWFGNDHVDLELRLGQNP